MGGGLMQLVAYGARDVYLTGNPQITFWKATYRRHTNFAIENNLPSYNYSDEVMLFRVQREYNDARNNARNDLRLLRFWENMLTIDKSALLRFSRGRTLHYNYIDEYRRASLVKRDYSAAHFYSRLLSFHENMITIDKSALLRFSRGRTPLYKLHI